MSQFQLLPEVKFKDSGRALKAICDLMDEYEAQKNSLPGQDVSLTTGSVEQLRRDIVDSISEVINSASKTTLVFKVT